MGKRTEYESMTLKRLDTTNKLNRLVFYGTVIAFVLMSGISYVYSFSFDPVLGLASIAILFGVFSILVMNFFIYGKIVMLLRLLAGDEDEPK